MVAPPQAAIRNTVHIVVFVDTGHLSKQISQLYGRLERSLRSNFRGMTMRKRPLKELNTFRISSFEEIFTESGGYLRLNCTVNCPDSSRFFHPLWLRTHPQSQGTGTSQYNKKSARRQCIFVFFVGLTTDGCRFSPDQCLLVSSLPRTMSDFLPQFWLRPTTEAEIPKTTRAYYVCPVYQVTKKWFVAISEMLHPESIIDLSECKKNRKKQEKRKLLTFKGTLWRF